MVGDPGINSFRGEVDSVYSVWEPSFFECEDLAIGEILDGVPQGTAGIGGVAHESAVFGIMDPPHLLRSFLA